MKTIIINSRKHGRHEVFIDDEDYERVSRYKWGINKCQNNFYAKRSVIKSSKSSTSFSIKLHRFIMNETNPKKIIDHKDRNGLNCQKSNLRSSTTSENCKNRRSAGKSKYLGVYLQINKRPNKEHKYWTAHITIGGKYTHLNQFPFTSEGEILAAKRYDEAAKIHHGEFANLNFK